MTKNVLYSEKGVHLMFGGCNNPYYILIFYSLIISTYNVACCANFCLYAVQTFVCMLCKLLSVCCANFCLYAVQSFCLYAVQSFCLYAVQSFCLYAVQSFCLYAV